MRHLVIALALLACLPSLTAAAEVPYSGNLLDSGTPVNGNRYIAINVYAGPVGGLSLYTQAESLAVVGGVYHTVLTVPDGTWFGGDRWIGVSINGGPELSPRMKYYAPSRPSPQLFEGTPGYHTVTENTWTIVDSVVVIVNAPGFVDVSHTGSAQWTGSVTIPGIEFEFSPTTPTTPGTFILPQHTGSTAAVNFKVVFPVTSGTTRIYFWARIVAAGQSYSIRTGHFQGFYNPN